MPTCSSPNTIRSPGCGHHARSVRDRPSGALRPRPDVRHGARALAACRRSARPPGAQPRRRSTRTTARPGSARTVAVRYSRSPAIRSSPAAAPSAPAGFRRSRRRDCPACSRRPRPSTGSDDAPASTLRLAASRGTRTRSRARQRSMPGPASARRPHRARWRSTRRPRAALRAPSGSFLRAGAAARAFERRRERGLAGRGCGQFPRRRWCHPSARRPPPTAVAGSASACLIAETSLDGRFEAHRPGNRQRVRTVESECVARRRSRSSDCKRKPTAGARRLK